MKYLVIVIRLSSEIGTLPIVLATKDTELEAEEFVKNYVIQAYDMCIFYTKGKFRT